jgi:hypothetical protein
MALASGVASASLWLSIFLAPLFLVPLQMAFGRLGKKGGGLAVVASILVLAPAELWRVFDVSRAIAPIDAFATLAFPIGAILALIIMNISYINSVSPTYRMLILGLLAGAIAAPAVASLLADEGLKTALTQSVAQLIDRFYGALPKASGSQPLPSPSSASSSSYDAAAFLAAFNPGEMVATTMNIFASCYAALFCLLFGGSWWVGSRISGEGSAARKSAPPLSEFRAPGALVWPFLASLGLLLLVLYFKAGLVYQAIAWNLVLAMSLVYAAQGMGIVTHLLTRLRVPRGFRIAFAALVLISAIGSPIGAAFVAILPLLGVTELWIPYRNPKGVGA